MLVRGFRSQTQGNLVFPIKLKKVYMTDDAKDFDLLDFMKYADKQLK